MRKLTEGELRTLAIAGGLLAVGAWLRSGQVASEVEGAIMSGGTVAARLTGYWPYKAGMSAAERLMEGGTNDRKGNPIYTLGMYQRGEAPYVSVAGDDAIWPYGQRIELDAWPGVVFRVVDTGGNFRGAGKVYRIVGREPLDIAVDYGTKVPTLATATIVQDDNFDGREVRTDRLAGYSGDVG